MIAGEAGGRRLAVPDGRDTRPTSDRAREGLFATISSIVGPLAGARVLDLYAGSGAVGLEALSRGAEHVLLVEHGARAARVIRAEHRGDRAARRRGRRRPGGTGAGPRARPAGGQDGTAPAGGQDGTAEGRYDVVFADPPYALADAAVTQVLSLLAEQGWLAPGALVIVERATRSRPLSWPDGFVPDRARRYGEATFWYGLVPETAGGTSAMTGLDHVLECSPKNRRGGTACNA